MAVNHLRLAAGFIILVGLHLALIGAVWPQGLTSRELLLLAASGAVGLVIGDAAYFSSLVLIGPATATLMVTSAPAFATAEAWFFLGEELPPRALLGAAITLVGILLAVRGRMRRDPLLRRQERADGSPRAVGVPASGLARRTLVLGLGLALVGTLCQATGQVLARPALRDVDALSATLVRISTAMLLLWGLLALRCAISGKRPAWWDGAMADRRALALTMGGVITGPSFGVWLSQVATKHAPVGIASTLMSLVPIFVMLTDWLLGRARPSALEVVGSLVAIAGVYVLVSAPVG